MKLFNVKFVYKENFSAFCKAVFTYNYWTSINIMLSAVTKWGNFVMLYSWCGSYYGYVSDISLCDKGQPIYLHENRK